MQMYRVVLQTKRSYSVLSELLQMLFHKSKNNTIMKPRRKASIFPFYTWLMFMSMFVIY